MLEVREGDPPLRDADGTLLLFTEEVARRAGVKVATIRHHNTSARRARRNGRPAHFPAPARLVRRTTVKEDGQPLTVTTPVWREDAIEAWLGNRLGPGGRPRTPARETPRHNHMTGDVKPPGQCPACDWFRAEAS
jgi:hypothetical protein